MALVLMTTASVLGYRFVRADVESAIYRQRLVELIDDYENLRDRYNDLVTETAVTELFVHDGKLTIRVASKAGVIHEIPTAFDPSGEIYVDYVVVGGRLWIRRVFDAGTPPGEGLVIDAERKLIDWDDEAVAYGKAVYRALGEGRWVITMTGSGALGLGLADEQTPALSEPPEIHRFDAIAQQTQRQVQSISARDVIARLVQGQ